MEKLMVAGVGEILWDVLDEGEKLGGAPINFAYHVNSLGAKGIPVSTIGKDERGRRATEVLRRQEISIDAVSLDADHPTGYVTAKVDDQGVAHYEFPDDTAWDHLHLNEFARSIAKNLIAVCFGTLAQRSPKTKKSIREFIDLMPDRALKVYDLNLRQQFYNLNIIKASLIMCNVFKLNDEELQIITQMLQLPHDEREAMSVLVKNFSLKIAVLTRGKNGSLIVSPKELVEHPSYPAKVADTIGAGDAFTAAVTLGFLLDYDLDAIIEHASRLAAYVCSQKGAMPPIPTELKLYLKKI